MDIVPQHPATHSEQLHHCGKCNRDLPASCFNRMSCKRSGLAPNCKECKHRWKRTTDKGVAYKRLSRRKWSKANPEKARAHLKVWRAVKDGTLKRLPCVMCGNTDVQGHHEDYSKPLDVIWFCRKHHQEHHAMAESR